MTTFSGTTLAGMATHIDNRAIDDLARDLSLPPILPNSAEYQEARCVFNKMIDKRPALIVRCRGVSDVLRAVRFACDHDLIVAVRGGAHNAAGFATCDGGIVIDLSPMRAVRVDVERRLARVEGGATWGDVDRETQAFGLIAVGGIVSTTGVAGLALGGGQGWFRRTFGMTCDNLVAADVVTADGRLLSVSEASHPDLFWALKGGGGNFGIVTSFKFRLHPLGPMVAFAGPVYAIDRARQILRRFADFAASAPDDVNANGVLWSIPAVPPFPQDLHGREVLIIGATYAGSPAHGHDVLRPLRGLDEPLLDMSTTLPYRSLQQLYDPFFRKGELLHYWKSIYLDHLGDDAIDAMLSGAAVRPSPRSLLAVHALGGAMSRVGAEQTPVGNRSAPFLVEVIGSWSEAAHTEQNVVWARHVFETMHSFSSGKVNPNFSSAGDNTPRFLHAAFGEHYPRLAEIKRRYDPTNLFRLNQNIAVTGT
jgi:FAD/FMN-containing dehydrogenase